MRLRCILVWVLCALSASAASRPNVLVIISDDQGYGDLGFHGNPRIRTPNLDQLARESVRLKYFYVTPVCAPTRASLLTGRYNYRTGVTDTYLGRAMMFSDEVTLAEIFSSAKYRTGIFGKWHLGDNYPMRPQDQGFQETLIHKGGGIGQPSDPPEGDSYFNPTLYRNGKAVKTKGYCTDIFSDAAMEFIRKHRSKPFFAWIAYNAPHTPLEVATNLVAPYTAMKLDDVTAKVYAMVSNVDDNVGRILRLLDELRIAEDTIVIFLTDNGPQQARYNAGMADRKGSVHEGGIRVPFFVRWPGHLQAGREVDRIAAHIDLAPTLLEACGIPARKQFDGCSLWPLLTGATADWPDRTLFFQWHRGETPELHRAFAARSQKYKLLQPFGAGEKWNGKKVFKFYDMENDLLESNDIADPNPDLVARMLKEYDAWFAAVKSSRNFALPSIVVGSKKEKPVVLTRQDWRGPEANWSTNGLGHWDVQILRTRKYSIRTIFPPVKNTTDVQLFYGDKSVVRIAQPGATNVTFNVRLPAGALRLETQIKTAQHAFGAHYLQLSW